MHGLRSGRVLSAEAFVPVVMEIHHPPGVIVFSSLEAHWTPLLLGFYGGFLTCCCSVAQLCPTLWDPMNYSTPGFPVLHNLQEFAQIRFHWAGDAIYVILCIFSFAFSLSQHQGLFLTQTWAIINFTSSPSPLIGMGVMRWGRGCVCKFLNIACQHSLEQEMLLVLITSEITRFFRVLCQKPGQRPIYIFLTIYTCPAFCPQTTLLRMKQKNPRCLLLGKL